MPLREVEFLIAGAGIAGLLLARALHGRGRSVAVAHDPVRAGAGEAAVGLLNPVRGQRYTLAWRAGEAFAVARATYARIGAAARQEVFRAVPVVRVLSSPQERARWEQRAVAVAAAGLSARPLEHPPRGYSPAPQGVVAIGGGGVVDARAVLHLLRATARAAGQLVEMRCLPEDCKLERTGVVWSGGGIRARRIILAGGADDLDHPWLRRVRLRAVAGESLHVSVPALACDAALVRGHHLAPLPDGTWMCGGTKVPDDRGSTPTPAGRAELEAFLAASLTVPWTVLAHRRGVRASTPDTRPVAGPIDEAGRVIVLNGLGSQGFSHGPWLAACLAAHLTEGAPLPDSVAPGRATTPADV